MINAGANYVFGELHLSGQCLRVTYYDQTSPELSRRGLLVVWPPGFDARINDDVVQVVGPDGHVQATAGDTIRLSGRKMSDDSGEPPEWELGRRTGDELSRPLLAGW